MVNEPDEADHVSAQSPPPEQGETTGRVVRTEELFGQDRVIWIEHAGERYRLRITRRNKLILQK